MANQPGNGRTTRDDQYHRSWRPQDQDRNEQFADHTQRSDDDRPQPRVPYDDRTAREDSRHMREDSRMMRDQARRMREETERYGGGQSGYGAGRFGDDRSMGPGYRNQEGLGRRGDRQYDEDRQGMNTDDRYTGRGGEGYWEDRTERSHYNSGYNQGGMGYGGSGVGDGMPPAARSQQGFRGGSAGAQDGRVGRSGQYPDRFGPNYGGNWDEQGQGARSRGTHRGKGPVGYTRSDDRIREAVCEALADDHHVDASHIEVVVKNGEVILTGHVEDRQQKRLAEDCALNQSGVQDVQNQLRVGPPGNPRPSSAVGKTETETSPTTDKKARS